MYQFNFDLNTFLAEFWQKRPALIKSGFADFQDPVSPDEMAGLAMEEEVDSRLVTNKDNRWQVKHGPFDSFDDFPESCAQLIIQAANHWHGEVHTLARAFNAFPKWLFDDVMVCFSQPMGGVGPHIDQYDVFIIQGAGRRRWRVGDKGNYKEANLHTGLRQIESFDAIIDEEVTAGDILYIPAGFPHEGESLDASLSYSVGFRSPKSQELLSNFADYVISQDMGDSHYFDEGMQARLESSAIYRDEYQRLMAMMESLLSDEKSKQKWLGEYLSQSRHELDILEPDEPWQQSDISQLLSEGAVLNKVAGLRTFYYPEAPERLHINGETFSVPEHCQQVAVAMCSAEAINADVLGDAMNDRVFLAVLTQLINQGYWYFEGYL